MDTSIHIGRLLKRGILLGIGGVVIGFLLILLVYCIPLGPIRENVTRSADEWHSEGPWPMMLNGYSSSILDNFTDSIMLSIAVFDNGSSALQQSMQNDFAMESIESLPFDSLYAYLHGSECYGESYSRYWHGYLVFLKPLLTLFTYSDLRILNAFALCLLICYVLYLFQRNLSAKNSFVFLISILFLMPLTLFLCLDMANMLYITLIALIILFKKRTILFRYENAVLFFMLVGMLTSYMDFLTYPMVSLGIPLITYIALLLQERRAVLRVKECLFPMLFWTLGYLGMWGSKWLISSLITGENVILVALRTVKKRSDLYADDSIIMDRLQAIGNNISILFQGAFGWIISALLIIFLVTFICNLRKRKLNWALLFSLVLVAIIPFGWYFVTSEHCSQHAWFTYRNLIIPLYALGTLCIHAFDTESVN